MLFLEEKSSLVLSCHLMNHSKCVVGERRAIRLQQEGAGKPLRLWPGTGIPVWCIMWDCFIHPGKGGFPSFLLFTPEEELQHCPLFPLTTPRHGAVQILASMWCCPTAFIWWAQPAPFSAWEITTLFYPLWVKEVISFQTSHVYNWSTAETVKLVGRGKI